MKIFSICIILVSMLSICDAQHSGHPRLFFNSAELQNLQNAINGRTPGSAIDQLYGEVLQQSNQFTSSYLWNLGGSHNKGAYYVDVFSLAFRYLISGDVQWSNRAKHLLLDPPNPDLTLQGIVYDDWLTPNGLNSNGDQGWIARGIAQQVICLSIMYDWLYDQLDTSQQRIIQNKIIDDINTTYTWNIYLSGVRQVFFREDIWRIRGMSQS